MSESVTEILLDEQESTAEPVHVITHISNDFDQSSDSSPTSSYCPPFVVYIIVVIYVILASFTNRGNASNMFEKNADCLRSRTETMDVEELWNKIPMIINQCSKRRYLRIRGYSNRDEIKVHVMPNEEIFPSEYACSVISLGVGRDVEVEKKMKKDMPICAFYGADPIKEPNQEMYEEMGVSLIPLLYAQKLDRFLSNKDFPYVSVDIETLRIKYERGEWWRTTESDLYLEFLEKCIHKVGVFYHIAVGGKNGTSEATVLEPDTASYRVREVKHVDIATFLRGFIRKQIIDQLMIDIEWEEYDVFPFLLKGGEIESTNVVLCQLNIEIHYPDYSQKAQFFEFFLELLDDARYMPLVADTMLGHIRLFILNHEHPECRRRYIENSSQ